MTSKDFLAACDAKAQKDAAARDVEPATSVVVVVYPGDENPVVTKVGEKTRYGELVADYFTAAGLTDRQDAKDWKVVAERELGRSSTHYGRRNLRDIISHDDYGKRLIVASADQGSVTGADVDPDYEAAKDAAESAA